LVAAGAGVAVAKHGNRSVSSRSGSADVLQSMGVRMDLTADEMSACLDEIGIAFLFAPTLHPATRHAVGPRRDLKLRTLFNLLGPLTNPAGATRQLLGVFDRERARLVAEVLSRLGTEHAWVVHGLEGLDELSITGPSVVFEVRGRGVPVRTLEIDPQALGFPAVDPAEILGGDPEENAAWLNGLLEGRVTDGSRHIVVLNAAAALLVAGKVATLEEGIPLAEETLTSGRAAAIFAQLREVSQRR
jgi:anthranilate phosphoribosyltransferase